MLRSHSECVCEEKKKQNKCVEMNCPRNAVEITYYKVSSQFAGERKI